MTNEQDFLKELLAMFKIEAEEHIKEMSGTDWTDERRLRVRPIELWYPVQERALFALFKDGRYIEHFSNY